MRYQVFDIDLSDYLVVGNPRTNRNSHFILHRMYFEPDIISEFAFKTMKQDLVSKVIQRIIVLE